AHGDLDILEVCHQGKQLAGERGTLGGGGVHLPISSDKVFAGHGWVGLLGEGISKSQGVSSRRRTGSTGDGTHPIGLTSLPWQVFRPTTPPCCNHASSTGPVR